LKKLPLGQIFVSVEHDHADAPPRRRSHHLDGGEEVGVVSGSYVRQIDEEELDAVEHRVGGGGTRAVKTIDW